MTEQSVTPDIDIFSLPVFGIADMFPMIGTDELDELAADISDNGLNDPIVVAQIDGQWMLVDGRNRLAACRIAGVTPHTRVLETDPTAYVLSANVHRRHLTKGQQAMATALAYPETKQGKKRTSSINEEVSKVSSGNLSMARLVLRNCRDKALEVLRNSKYPLTVAYEEAQAIVEKQRLDEEERQKNLAALDELRIEYPDLAALVDDQRLGLPEAIAAGVQRRETARMKAEQEAREAAEKARREREEEDRKRKLEEEKLKEEERQELERKRQEQANYEANRAAFHYTLHQLLQGSVLVSNPASRKDSAKWKGSWTAFYRKYEISIQEARQRLTELSEHIPFILETLESMRDE